MHVTHVILTIMALICTATPLASSQTDSFTKNFKYHKNVASNIEIYASGPTVIESYDAPVREARQRLVQFLGPDLAKGALVICSTLEQKDSVNEIRILKQGFRWVLTVLTPEATSEQIIAQMKARAGGGEIPPERLARIQNPPPEMKAAATARVINSTLLRMGYAIIHTTLAPDLQYRSSRLEDMGRSPLADWLDMGLASYAAGDAALNLRFLQEHLEEGFPLEDLLSMSRPFVAPTEGGSAAVGGGQFTVRTSGDGGGNPNGASGRGVPPGGGAGEAQGGNRFEGPPPGGLRGGGGFNLPKDVQDRMIFDCQSAAFFKYSIEKMGIEKTREIVQWNREGKLAREALFRQGYMDINLDDVERDWLEWIKKLKGDGPGGGRLNPGKAQPPAVAVP